MLLISLRRRIGPLGLRRLFVSLLKMAAATAGMCFAVVPLYDLLLEKLESMPAAFVLAALAGALLYGVLNILLRTREMGLLIVGLAERLTPRRARED